VDKPGAKPVYALNLFDVVALGKFSDSIEGDIAPRQALIVVESKSTPSRAGRVPKLRDFTDSPPPTAAVRWPKSLDQRRRSWRRPCTKPR